MRRPISWSALADASVGVWGLGVEGQASIRRLRSMGRDPVLVDDAPAAPALDGAEILATGDGGLAALHRCDVVVKSPGISRYRPEVVQLEKAGVAVCGGLGLFMAEADPTRVACITGTKGKSTTTALAVHLLTGLGARARAGGNIGLPPWDPAGGPAPDYWIVETSSFQVPDLENGPAVVAVTSLSPDHLDWHGTVERYYADKLSLCTKPGVTLALADGSDEELRAHAALLGPHLRWVSGAEVERDTRWSASLGLTGPHNARNASVARAVLEGLGIPGRVRREPAGRSGAGFRRAAQPLPLAGLGRRGRVRRRRPLHQCAAGTGRAGGVRRASRGAARRRARPGARLRTARPDDRGTHRADARRHHARQRAAHRASRARHHRAGRSKCATPPAWRPRSRPRSTGPGAAASSCSRRRRPASGASVTIGSARPPSPRRSRRLGTLS